MIKEDVLKLIAIMENKGDCKKAGTRCLICPLLNADNECRFTDSSALTVIKARQTINALISKSLIRIDNDVNGNPRYLIHYTDLGLKDHESSKLTKKFFRKYNSKKYAGYFVCSSYNVQRHIVQYFQEEMK